MKKYLTLGLVLILAALANAQTFRPDMRLLITGDEDIAMSHKELGKLFPEKLKDPFPYIAVFEKDGKPKLIYLAAEHTKERTFDMVDYIYKNFNPQIAVVEWERTGRDLNTCEGGSPREAAYSAARASDNNIPFILSDLADKEKYEISGFSENYISDPLVSYKREVFMIENITAALNTYDVVYAVFGEWHYLAQRKILEQMLGKPYYIWKNSEDVPFKKINDCRTVSVR